MSTALRRRWEPMLAYVRRQNRRTGAAALVDTLRMVFCILSH